jgi:hypothetical protein
MLRIEAGSATVAPHCNICNTLSQAGGIVANLVLGDLPVQRHA